MTYVFGYMNWQDQVVEYVKIIDVKHTNLQGFCHIVQYYSDNVLTDDFRIIEKYRSEDNGEYCYDWYIIDEHNRIIDYFTPAKPIIEKSIDDAYDATCELSETTEESVAALEQAICELSEEIYGGE